MSFKFSFKTMLIILNQRINWFTLNFNFMVDRFYSSNGKLMITPKHSINRGHISTAQDKEIDRLYTLINKKIGGI
jgi:hypothetical protein